MNTIFLRKMSERLELPTDAVLGDSLIDIIGKNVIYIENYRGILEFNDCNLKIQCKKFKISITGEKLKIEYYNDSDLKVLGVIDGITFY